MITEFGEGLSQNYNFRHPDRKVKRFQGAPTDLNLGSNRDHPGVRKRERMAHHGSAYGYRDPALLCYQPTPPPELQQAIEDVFGKWMRFENGDLRIKLARHPHTKEWALYQRVHRGLELWKCIWRAREQNEVEGQIHKDFQNSKYDLALGKHLGAVYEPARDHFEMLQSVNIKQHGVDAVCQAYEAPQEAVLKETERVMQLRDEDYLDNIWLSETDRANQAAGSGQKMRSFPFEMELARAKERVQNWIIEEVKDENGHVRYRRKRNRTLTEYREAVLQGLVDALLAHDERVSSSLQRKRTPEQVAQRRREMAEAINDYVQATALESIDEAGLKKHLASRLKVQEAT